MHAGNAALLRSALLQKPHRDSHGIPAWQARLPLSGISSRRAAVSISPPPPSRISDIKFSSVLTLHIVDLSGQITGAESIVDIHDADAAGTGIEHRKQCRRTAERGAAADTGRYRDDRRVSQTADDRRDAPSMPRSR